MTSEQTRSTEETSLLPIKHSHHTFNEQSHHALLGIACVAASAICFSFMSTFVKFETYTISSMEAVFWRSIVALVLNFGCIMYEKRSIYIPIEHRLNLIIRCIVGFSSIAFVFYAISQMVLADASVLVFTSPIITFFLGACMLSEAIDITSFIGACFAFIGVVCVVRPGFIFGYDSNTQLVTTLPWIGVLSAILGATGQSLVYIYVRKLKMIPVLVMTNYFMLFSTITSFAFICIVDGLSGFVLPHTTTLWIAVIGSGVFTFAGQTLLIRGFQLEKAGIASVMRFLDVVFVFIWDDVLLGESISSWSIIGAVIICSSAVLIVHRRIKQN